MVVDLLANLVEFLVNLVYFSPSLILIISPRGKIPKKSSYWPRWENTTLDKCPKDMHKWANQSDL